MHTGATVGGVRKVVPSSAIQPLSIGGNPPVKKKRVVERERVKALNEDTQTQKKKKHRFQTKSEGGVTHRKQSGGPKTLPNRLGRKGDQKKPRFFGGWLATAIFGGEAANQRSKVRIRLRLPGVNARFDDRGESVGNEGGQARRKIANSGSVRQSLVMSLETRKELWGHTGEGKGGGGQGIQ